MAGVMRRGGGLIAAHQGGGAGANSRPAGVPTLVNGRLPNSTFWFEDFHTATIGNAGFATGLTATPDTLVNLGPLGNPAWIATETNGSTGTVGLMSGGAGPGIVNLQTGTTAGNSLMLDHGGVRNTSQFRSYINPAYGALFMMRFSFNGTATTGGTCRGCGWPGATLGSDWVTDPDTALAATSGLIVTRHVTALAGDAAKSIAANDLAIRYYGGTAGADNTGYTLVASASVTTAFYKLEAYVPPGGTAIQIYLDGVQKTSIPFTDTSMLFRPGMGVVTGANAVRQLQLDCFYEENGAASAR